jgi:muconolactone D-isomerase
MEFLVNIVIDVPAQVPRTELKRLIQAESMRARELAEAGILLRLWRTAGVWTNWGLWAASDRAALDKHLGSLPLYSYMRVTVHPLRDHPNDPQRSRDEPHKPDDGRGA